jgi:hypothetical protein
MQRCVEVAISPLELFNKPTNSQQIDELASHTSLWPNR